jgi:phage-related protein
MMLHAFVKKSAKTPARELKVARQRMREVQANDDA